MIYVVYGLDSYLIDSKIKEIVSDNDVVNYDLDFDSLKDILFDASMMSFLSEKKYIVINNPYFLVQASSDTSVIDTSVLEEYLLSPNPNTVMIFRFVREKLAENKKITKLIRSKATCFNLNKSNVFDFVRNEFSGYTISDSDMKLLINRVGDNFSILKNEIEKLKLYKIDEKSISAEDILELHENIDVDFFKFIDHIINGDKVTSLKEYFTLLENREEPLKILIVLANKIRLMYQVKKLSEKGYTTNEIGKMLDVHPYAAQMAGLSAKKYSSSKLLDTLDALCDLDERIKTGKASASNALELFIINLW